MKEEIIKGGLVGLALFVKGGSLDILCYTFV